MKRAFLLSPLIAAVFFTVPESWQLMNAPDSDYIPVIYELLMLFFGFLAALIINSIIIIPLCWLVRLKSSNLLLGLVLACFISLIGTTVAYAFEIFGYQPHILHPAYLYPLLIPLFVLTVLSFFFLTRRPAAIPAASADDGKPEDGEENNAP